MRTTLFEYCTGHDRPELLAEWDGKKNAPLMPENVTYGSRRSVWWKCDRGHEWQSMVYSRTGAESRCPYCAGKKAYPSGNDLASQRPDLAAQWHPTLNGSLTPTMVTAGSHRKVWWMFPVGHIWKAMIYARAGPQKNGCPVCAGRAQPRRMERYRLALADGAQRKLWARMSQTDG